MNDLFTAAAEMAEERAAIREFDGLMTRADAERLGKLESEEWRHACEVRFALSLPLPERRDFLAKVEKSRGVVVANRLRQLVSEEWMRRKTT